jgi:ribonuclease P protein component
MASGSACALPGGGTRFAGGVKRAGMFSPRHERPPAPLSFPKTLRLLRRNEFRRVYQEGRRRSAALCTVFYRSNGLRESRLGLTIPVAVGNAVLRNRVRRRVREVFRLHRSSIPAGWDIVVNPRREVARLPFATLERELMRLFPQVPPPSAPPPASGEIKAS